MLKYFTGKSPLGSSAGLNYSEEEPVESQFGSIQSYKWYQATQKSGSELASLFKYSYNARDYGGDKNDQVFAERHLQCIKLLMHPCILKVLKVKKSDTSITIATERCYPLSASSVSFDPALGFSQIFSAIDFLHTKCNKTYGLVTPTGVVVREDGSWCLSSFECAVDNETSIHRVLADLKCHSSWRDGWRPPIPDNASVSCRQLDQWGLGALMCWVYTLISGHVELRNLRRQDCDLHSLRRYAPSNLQGLIDQLMSPNCDVDLAGTLRTHPYFCSNVTVAAVSFALEFHIKTEEQVNEFFTNLPASLPRIPIAIACKQLLPEILKTLSIHTSLVPKILESVVIICKSIIVDDFRAKVYPHISRLFKSNDRSIRYSLLKFMPDLDPLLDEREVSGDLFESILTGFGDSSSQIRDETVKTMVYVFKKIKRRQQNNAVMLLLKCVEDVEPTIRVNSIICFAKIIPFIQQDILVKVIPQAWGMALHDPFLKSRLAALDSITASHGFFTPEHKVQILLPAACSTLLDSDQQVRKLALDTVYTILGSLKGNILDGEKKDADAAWAAGAQSPTTGTPKSPAAGSSPMHMPSKPTSPRSGWTLTAACPQETQGLMGMNMPNTMAQNQKLLVPDKANKGWGMQATEKIQDDPMSELQDFFDPFPAKK